MKHQKRYYQEFASITPTYTSFYSRPLENYNNTKRVRITPVEKRKDNRSIRRLQKALHYLIITSPLQYTYCKELKKRVRFRLNFITLTLSGKQCHSDKFIKSKMLDLMLKWIVYKGATGYVWKAEAQNNGNIHFHIVANKYIHWKDIRAQWNSIQMKYEYLAAFTNNNGHSDANSTDVHAIKQEKEALKYMSKYIMKLEPDKREIDGHKFGYSRNLADIKITLETTTKSFKEIDEYLASLKPHTKRFDFVTVTWHELINLNLCPKQLADLIQDQTHWKPSKISK